MTRARTRTGIRALTLTTGFVAGFLALAPSQGQSAADIKIIPGSACQHIGGSSVSRTLTGVSGAGFQSSEVACPLYRDKNDTQLDVSIYGKDSVACTIYSCNTAGGNYGNMNGCNTDTTWGAFGSWWQYTVSVPRPWDYGTDTLRCSIPGATAQVARIIYTEN